MRTRLAGFDDDVVGCGPGPPPYGAVVSLMMSSHTFSKLPRGVSGPILRLDPNDDEATVSVVTTGAPEARGPCV
jgi:hypothetical protein